MVPSTRLFKSDLSHTCTLVVDFGDLITKIYQSPVMEVRGDSHSGVILWIKAQSQQNYKLKLVDTPRDDTGRYSEDGYSDALDFIRSACPIGSIAYVDLDDDYPTFRNGPNVGIVWCGREPVSLNQQLLDLGHMSLPENFDSIHP